MSNIQELKTIIKSRLGELWWYTILLFVAQQLGTVINTFIGLWLIPKYVPQAELGAILPLAQVGTALTVPLSVLAITFSKYVNLFATQGEYGKVKALLRDAFCLAGIVFLIVIIYAQFFMSLVFTRLRVGEGMLGILVVTYGVTGGIGVFFVNALQALKKFRLFIVTGFVSAPLRLLVLLVCLPIRAISGYFVGQIIPMLYTIGMAVFGLRSILFNKEVVSVPYLRSDGLSMLRFTIPVFIGTLLGTLQILTETFVIRHRLPDIESAGYYMISRLAEIANYVGGPLVFILFPLVAEQYEKGGKSQKLIIQSIIGTLLPGLLFAGILALSGRFLLALLPSGGSYISYVPHMAVLTIIFALRGSVACYIMCELARRQYGFYLFAGVIALIESLFLYGITGFSYFSPWVPSAWVEWVTVLNPARLGFVLGVMFFCSAILLGVMVLQLILGRKSAIEDGAI